MAKKKKNKSKDIWKKIAVWFLLFLMVGSMFSIVISALLS